MIVTFEDYKEAKELAERCYCPLCGALRTKTPSGAVCLDHFLVLGITGEDLGRAPHAKEIMELPIAYHTARNSKVYRMRGRKCCRVIKGEPEFRAVLIQGGRLFAAGFRWKKEGRKRHEAANVYQHENYGEGGH